LISILIITIISYIIIVLISLLNTIIVVTWKSVKWKGHVGNVEEKNAEGGSHMVAAVIGRKIVPNFIRKYQNVG
jgi:high-affinity nickel permease